MSWRRPVSACGQGRLLALAFLGCFTLPLAAVAQDEPESPADTDPRVKETPDSQSFWECQLDGGSFLVPLGHIVSISQHEYVVDGVARVYEATLSTNSSVVARFYFLEPVTGDSALTTGREALNRAQALLEEASGRAGVEPLWKKVVKNYPASTHAHTVEYRLLNKADVGRIYSSVSRCLRSGRGAQLRIVNG